MVFVSLLVAKFVLFPGLSWWIVTLPLWWLALPIGAVGAAVVMAFLIFGLFYRIKERLK